MVQQGGGMNYVVNIGPFDAGVTIDYFITATDDSTNHNEAIDNNSDSFYTFDVIDPDDPTGDPKDDPDDDDGNGVTVVIIVVVVFGAAGAGAFVFFNKKKA